MTSGLPEPVSSPCALLYSICYKPPNEGLSSHPHFTSTKEEKRNKMGNIKNNILELIQYLKCVDNAYEMLLNNGERLVNGT